MPSRHVNTVDRLVALPACSFQRMVTLALIAMSLVVPSSSGNRAHSAERTRVPNIVFILADDKYGQGIVNREFLSENKVFYHQSVESALAAI